MSYDVRLTEGAEADVERRLMELADRSPKAAERLNDGFEQALIRLRDFPLSCGPAYEADAFPEPLRHVLFWGDPRRKYRAVFVVRGETVVVLAVRAPGEKPILPEDVEL